MLLSATPVWKYSKKKDYYLYDDRLATATDILLQYGCTDDSSIQGMIRREWRTEELFDWIKCVFPAVHLRYWPVILSGKTFKILYPGDKYIAPNGSIYDEDFAQRMDIKNKTLINDTDIIRVYKFRVRGNRSRMCYRKLIQAKL